MNCRIELICVKEDGTEERREVLTFAKEQLAMETLGLTWPKAKPSWQPSKPVSCKRKRPRTWRSAVPVPPVESRTGAKSRAKVQCTPSLVPSLFPILAGIAVPVSRLEHEHFVR